MAIEPYFKDDDTDPLNDMGIVERGLINEILDRDGNCLKSCGGDVDLDADNRVCLIKVVKGNLVLKSRRHSEILKKLKIANLIMNTAEGQYCTILDELHSDELYERIKSFLTNLIKLTPSSQKELFYGTSILKGFSWEEILNMINNSANYVIALPNEPSDIEKKELSQQVFCDGLRLFFSFELKDDHSVQLGSYASELGNRLFGKPNFCNLPLV